MSADLLHRAAKVLRERAEAATPPAWRAVHAGHWAVETDRIDDGHLVADMYLCEDHAGRERPDAEYIALMHPPVALVLADCMEVVARMGDHGGDYVRRAGHAELIAVARAILREPEATP